jgi:hypothetical protein
MIYQITHDFSFSVWGAFFNNYKPVLFMIGWPLYYMRSPMIMPIRSSGVSTGAPARLYRPFLCLCDRVWIL